MTDPTAWTQFGQWLMEQQGWLLQEVFQQQRDYQAALEITAYIVRCQRLVLPNMRRHLPQKPNSSTCLFGSRCSAHSKHLIIAQSLLMNLVGVLFAMGKGKARVLVLSNIVITKFRHICRIFSPYIINLFSLGQHRSLAQEHFASRNQLHVSLGYANLSYAHNFHLQYAAGSQK